MSAVILLSIGILSGVALLNLVEYVEGGYIMLIQSFKTCPDDVWVRLDSNICGGFLKGTYNTTFHLLLNKKG